MKANGARPSPSSPGLKGEATVDIAMVQKALKTYADAAAKMPA
jgi:hypothetical protein